MKKETDDTIIKDVRNLCRLKKEIDNNTGKDIRNLLRLKKENKATKELEILGTFSSIKKRIIKPVREGNFWSNNYIEYESNLVSCLPESSSRRTAMARRNKVM